MTHQPSTVEALHTRYQVTHPPWAPSALCLPDMAQEEILFQLSLSCRLLTLCVSAGGPTSDLVVRDFHDALARSPDTAVAVAAIKVISCNCASSSHT